MKRLTAAPREEDQGRDPEPSSAGVGRGLRWWQQDGCVADPASVCRSFATGCCASTPADRTGWSMGSHRAHPRSSTPITAAHWRRLLRPPGPGGRRRRALAAQGPGAVALGDVRHPLDETTVGRELKALGFVKISARPRHYAQNELAVEAFKKNFPAELAKIRARLPKGVEIELWWQDEARIGQKNKLTRRWARRGTRPRAPRDQRTEWAYILCPRRGKAPGWSCPGATPTPWRRTSEISAAVDPGAHAVLIVDQAGWHLTPKLARQHHRPGAAATIARVEPGGECPIPRQLVVEPDEDISRCAAKFIASRPSGQRSATKACAEGDQHLWVVTRFLREGFRR